MQVRGLFNGGPYVRKYGLTRGPFKYYVIGVMLVSLSFTLLRLFGFAMNKLCCKVLNTRSLFSFSSKELCSQPSIDIN